MKEEMAAKASYSFRNKKAEEGENKAHKSLQCYSVDDSFTFSQFVLLTRSIIPVKLVQNAKLKP